MKFLLIFLLICITPAIVNAGSTHQPEIYQSADGKWYALVHLKNRDEISASFMGGIIKKIGTVPKPSLASFSVINESTNLVRISCSAKADLMLILAMIRNQTR